MEETMIRFNLKVNITPEQLEEIANELREQRNECLNQAKGLEIKNLEVHSKMKIDKGQVVTFVWKS